MSHFRVWIVLTAGGVIGAATGISSWETAAATAWFCGFALLVHWLYEDEA